MGEKLENGYRSKIEMFSSVSKKIKIELCFA